MDRRQVLAVRARALSPFGKVLRLNRDGTIPSDGRALTISNFAGASSNKICFVEIFPA